MNLMPERPKIPEIEELSRQMWARFDAMTDLERAQALVRAGIFKPNGEVEDRFKNAFRPVPGKRNILAEAAKANGTKPNGSN